MKIKMKFYSLKIKMKKWLEEKNKLIFIVKVKILLNLFCLPL